MKKTKFKPKPGQIDYRRARWSPVVNCVVAYRKKILLVKRSAALEWYPGYWNGISGFLDDGKDLYEKVAEELKEELGVPKRAIRRIAAGPIFDQDAPRYRKTWIVHPVLVTLKTDRIRLNWEAGECRWVKSAEAARMKLLPGFAEVMKRLL